MVHAEGFGFANIAAGEAYRPEHRHRIGSITKTMVSLCIMALVDEGRLSLDDRVRDLLPDIPLHGHGDQLLVRHLLSHTGGLGEAPNPEDLKKPFETLFYDSDPGKSLADLYTNGLTVEAPPNTKWAYANHGFALLGETVSRKEGGRLNEIMAARVFEPLAMRESDLDDKPHPDLARGYTQAETPEQWQLVRLMGIKLASEEKEDGYNMPGEFVGVWGNGGAGAVQSTVPDMCTYASALLDGSRGVVRPETLAEMTRPHWQPDARLPGWGLGFSTRTVGGHLLFGHGGAVFGGWNSWLGVFPKLDAALVLHTNLMYDGWDTGIVPRLVSAFLGAKEEVLPAVNVDEQVLATAPGVYELPNPGPLTNFRPLFNAGRIKLAAEDGALMMYSRRGPWKTGVQLVPVRAGEPDFFTIAKEDSPPQYLVLLRDDAGAVNGIRFQMLCDYVRNPDVDWPPEPGGAPGERAKIPVAVS
jgi:CubicO group peptidase (beta-lactamase class C family)